MLFTFYDVTVIQDFISIQHQKESSVSDFTLQILLHLVASAWYTSRGVWRFGLCHWLFHSVDHLSLLQQRLLMFHLSFYLKTQIVFKQSNRYRYYAFLMQCD